MELSDLYLSGRPVLTLDPPDPACLTREGPRRLTLITGDYADVGRDIGAEAVLQDPRTPVPPSRRDRSFMPLPLRGVSTQQGTLRPCRRSPRRRIGSEKFDPVNIRRCSPLNS